MFQELTWEQIVKPVEMVLWNSIRQIIFPRLISEIRLIGRIGISNDYYPYLYKSGLPMNFLFGGNT